MTKTCELMEKIMENKLTLFDKVWDTHVVKKIEGGPDFYL